MPRAMQSGKPDDEQMGVRKVAKGGGFLIFFSRLDINTPVACAQITFCGIQSDSKVPVKSDGSQMEGE